MSERELPKLQDMGDGLIADIAKPSQAVDKTFCMVLPTDGANCYLSDSQSL